MRTLTLLAVLSFAARAAAVPFLVPIDVNALAAKGEVKLTATAFDINDASKVFDADRDSLARTASINPALVEAAFTAPQSVSGFRVRFTAEKHDYTVSVDGEIAARGTFQGEDVQTVRLKRPASGRVFRLDVQRREGDDYVHIMDWELLQPGEVTGLSIAGPKGDVMEESVLKLSAAAKTADGRELDVTKDVRWSAASANVDKWRSDSQFRLTAPGEAQIAAALGDLHASLTVPVQAYKAGNSAFDLDAMYIERTPRIDYDANKATGGWPKPGQRVVWKAHLHNWGDRDVPSVNYQWILDGVPVLTGVLYNWKAGADETVTCPWRWEQKRHELAFLLDTRNAYPDERTKANNQIAIATDALAVGYWVEDGLARHMHEHQIEMGDGMNSFEDWGQRQMNRWNQMFANARYATSPSGIVDRVRLDTVVHVPSGALPFNGGLPTNNPDAKDKTVDLMWGMVARDMDTFWKPSQSGPFYYEYGLMHELDHARYLVDAYGFDVHSNQVDKVLGADGKPLLGTPALPGPKDGVVRYDKYKGMMDSTHYFSEHEAYAWNRIAGQRARKGNQNGPDDIGVYLGQDLPLRNHFRIVDANRKPLPGAVVEVHQARPQKDAWYGKTYVTEPDATYTADNDGWITLPRNPFGAEIHHDYGHANTTLLILVKANGVTRAAFQEITDFNLQYAAGQREDARYELQVNLAPDNTDLGVTRRG
ncbi:MAG TPA: hypothetical protein VGM37_04665 [Armatimonadota bacterium]